MAIRPIFYTIYIYFGGTIAIVPYIGQLSIQHQICGRTQFVPTKANPTTDINYY